LHHGTPSCDRPTGIFSMLDVLAVRNNLPDRRQVRNPFGNQQSGV
jgi:hypothetical protein